MTTSYDAIVLAGGAARRLGGVDKPAVTVGGRPLLDRVLGACRHAGRTVVVGDPRSTSRPVRWTREEQPGGGPLPGIDAGLRHVEAEVVLVLSADLPFLGEATVRRLVEAVDVGDAADGTDREAAVVVDAEGREQLLVAAYRTASLRRELSRMLHDRRDLAHLPVRLLTKGLRTARIDADPLDSFDCDTWEDIAAARARIREHGNVLDEWITAVKDELGIELDVDTGVLLDLARDAAHGVARPAAPLTTFLVGYAAARAGADGGPEAVAEAARKAAALANRWAAESEQGDAG
ncbi:NTP transferase domain-containing protein [Streptomyces solicathayae]|uniref:NTP transferase domain-containing protein n=1 Tax=Streptomyces solicathayae TaxID=3081768 RepID=A0ABZ0LUM3_9ACTN|nr:NTP transferase domain-containing protein [Streptomyces sp. HUAS YS2]WOX23199.1 NTP transferase domain-containing protein [Streptomyces sp. HUAS YS2]